MIKLSLIIPNYNEEQNLLSGVLDQIIDYLSAVDFNYEVIIVDDASIDKSRRIIRKKIKNLKNFRLIENSHAGKAVTVMTGLINSKGEIALFTDMDQSTPLKEFEKFIPKFDQGFDIVIGSRSGRPGAPLIRKLYALGFIILRNILLGIPFKDTQCGFKAFTHRSVITIFPKLLKQWNLNHTEGAAVNAGFDIETLFIAKKRGLKVAEVPVDWHYVGSERVGIKSAIESLKDMIRIRINNWRGYYN